MKYISSRRFLWCVERTLYQSFYSLGINKMAIIAYNQNIRQHSRYYQNLVFPFFFHFWTPVSLIFSSTKNIDAHFRVGCYRNQQHTHDDSKSNYSIRTHTDIVAQFLFHRFSSFMLVCLLHIAYVMLK